MSLVTNLNRRTNNNSHSRMFLCSQYVTSYSVWVRSLLTSISLCKSLKNYYHYIFSLGSLQWIDVVAFTSLLFTVLLH